MKRFLRAAASLAVVLGCLTTAGDRDHGRCVCGKLCYPGRGDLYHDGQNEAGPIRPAFNAGRPFLSLLRLQAKRPATTLPESMTAESDSFPEMTSV